MKRWIEHLFGGVVALSGVAVLVVPFVILMVWAVAYLGSVLSHLSAPGVPIRLQYVAEGGVYNLQADSYAIDTTHRLVRLSRARLIAPDGQGVVSAGDTVVRYDSGVVNAQVRGLNATIVRRPDGRFSFEYALPKSTGEPGKVPFRVLVSDVTVRYTDSSQSPHLPLDLRSSLVEVAGVGDDIAATSDVDVVGSGRAAIRIQLSGLKGVRVTGQANSLEVAPLLAHIERWLTAEALEHVTPMRATRLWTKGRVQLEFPKEGSVSLNGTFEAKGEGVVLSDILSRARTYASGTFTNTGIVGAASVEEPSRKASFRGACYWGPQTMLDGILNASSSSSTALWRPVKKMLPQGYSFHGGAFSGRVKLVGERYDLRGVAGVREIVFQGERITDVEADVSLATDAVALKSRRARWLDLPVTAAMHVDLRTTRVSGFARLQQAELGGVAARLGVSELRGTGSLDLLLSGTTDLPQAIFVAKGAAAWVAKGQPSQYVGIFEGGGNIGRSGVRIERFALSSPSGAYTGEGTYRFRDQNINLALKGGAINLKSFVPDVSGLAFFDTTITGSAAQPRVSGSVEVYALNYGDISVPIVVSEVYADRNTVRLTSLTGESGGSRVLGNVAWNRVTDALDGQFAGQSLQVADWIGGTASGEIEMTEGRITGNVQNPTLTAMITGTKLSASDFLVDTATGKLEIDKTQASLRDLTASVGGGEARGHATYVFGDRSGTVDATLDGVPLLRLPTQSFGVELDGSLSGTAHLESSGGLLDRGEANFVVSKLDANGTAVGDGTIHIVGQDNKWEGGFAIGTNDRFIIADRLTLDTIDRTIDGQVDVLNMRIEDILASAARKRENLSEVATRLLTSTFGAVDAAISLSGSLDNPNIDVSGGKITSLQVADRRAGAVDADVSRIDGVWSIKKLIWHEGVSRISAKGNVNEEGIADIGARVDNFDLTWLTTLGLIESPLVATLSSELDIKGTLDNPDASGTLGLRYGEAPSDLQPSEERPTVQLDDVRLKDRVIHGEGRFAAYGFTGKLAGEAPLATLMGESPQSGGLAPVKVAVTMEERDLDELKPTMPWLDEDRTSARLKAALTLEGTPDNYSFAGEASLVGTSLAATDTQTSFKDPSIILRLNQDVLTLTGTATGSNGGVIDLNATANLANPLESGQTIEGFLAQSSLKGSLALQNLRFGERTSRTERQEGTIESANLAFAGTLQRPAISGEIVLGQADITIPTLEESQGTPTYVVIPRFDDILLRIADQARLRTSALVIDVGGRGMLSGTLEYPKVFAQMDVKGGVFTLPTARVTLEEGGTMVLRYETAARTEPLARLDLNLEGSTAVSASRLADTVERYDITLRITGNMLEEGGISLAASSDPPDLSQQEILALIGQTDIIEAIARQAPGRGQNPIRDAVFGYALPSLSSPITQGVATGLNLDQFSIEYNALDQFTLSAAKTLAKGLSISARRQLVAPVNGPMRWELKLVYRLPSRNAILSRTRLGLGITHDRPWRVTLDYTVRF